MKVIKIVLSTVLISLLTGIGWQAAAQSEKEAPVKPLEIGSEVPMPDHKVRTVSGDEVTLGQMEDSKGLLVLFTCNTCPYVKAWEDRYPDIYRLTVKHDLGMIALNPNEGTRSDGDGFSDMKKRAKEKKYRFPYALDRHHRLADAFGATRTPEIFLFDQEMKLVYHGAIDDNYESAENVEKPYLKNAIENLSDGKTIKPATTKSLGCSIKRGD